MIIQKRRIRNVARYLPALQHGTPIIVGVPLEGVSSRKLTQIGFSENPNVNTAILPSPIFGPISVFNANGKEQPQRDQPMETVTRWVYRTWEDWHGNSHSGYVACDYQRYPRRFVPPPGEELRISITTENEWLITTEKIVFEPTNFSAVAHAINLLLEIFQECHVFTENLGRIIQAPLQRLNWRLLPPGSRTFEQLTQEVAPIVRRQPDEHQPVIMQRLETINAHAPDFVAIGKSGFEGYVVFGFQERQIFLFESVFIDNATYVFGDDWKALSQMTKGDIINNNLAQARIYHRPGWHQEIRQLLA
ncbi:MAG: hypothetical protein IAE97_14230 [Chthoniobacterales bacterium]|nr:hypothetical protein [Chthoniobacterales bacterium]